MFRCFSRSHPIYKLLRPHLQTVSAINTLGRELLIGAAAVANFTLSLSKYDELLEIYLPILTLFRHTSKGVCF